MQRKQGVIQVKISNKASFKNLINIQDAKVTSRSKSKSQKSKSQSKISSVSNKTPKKLIPRPKQNNNPEPYASMKTPLIERQQYSQVTSQINRSVRSRTPKKSKNFQQSMKKIILLKNKTVQLQQTLMEQQQTLQTFQVQSKPKYTINRNKKEQISQKSANMLTRLDQHLEQVKLQCKKITQKYYKDLDLMSEKNQQQFALISISNQKMKTEGTAPKMQKLEQKIRNLQKLLI